MTAVLKALREGEFDHVVSGYPAHAAVVTPHDTNDLDQPGYVRANDAGDIAAIPYGSPNNAVVTITLAAGEFYPCLVKRVRNTGTTVTTIHVFY